MVLYFHLFATVFKLGIHCKTAAASTVIDFAPHNKGPLDNKPRILCYHYLCRSLHIH